MVGVGKWSAKISTLFFRGEVRFEVIDNNGEYDFKFEIPEKFQRFKYRYFDVHAEGNTIYGKGELLAFPGKIAEAAATFEGDKMTAKITVPFMKNMTVKVKGKRI